MKRTSIALGVLLLAMFVVWLVMLRASVGPPPLQVSEAEAEQVARQAWLLLAGETPGPEERAASLRDLYPMREAIASVAYESVRDDPWQVSVNGIIVQGTISKEDPAWSNDRWKETIAAIDALPVCEALRAYIVVDALAGSVANSTQQVEAWASAAGLRFEAIRQCGAAAESAKCAGGSQRFEKLRKKHMDQVAGPWEPSPLPRRMISDRMIDDCCE